MTRRTLNKYLKEDVGLEGYDSIDLTDEIALDEIDTEWEDALEAYETAEEDYLTEMGAREEIAETMVSIESHLDVLQRCKEEGTYSRDVAALAHTFLRQHSDVWPRQPTASLEDISDYSLEAHFDELITSMEGFKDFMKKVGDKLTKMSNIAGALSDANIKLGKAAIKKTSVQLARIKSLPDEKVEIKMPGSGKSLTVKGRYPSNLAGAIRAHQKAVGQYISSTRPKILKTRDELVKIFTPPRDVKGAEKKKFIAEAKDKAGKLPTPYEMIPKEISDGSSMLGIRVVESDLKSAALVGPDIVVKYPSDKDAPKTVTMTKKELVDALEALKAYGEFLVSTFDKIAVENAKGFNKAYREVESFFYFDAYDRAYWKYSTTAYYIPSRLVRRDPVMAVLGLAKRGISALKKAEKKSD